METTSRTGNGGSKPLPLKVSFSQKTELHKLSCRLLADSLLPSWLLTSSVGTPSRVWAQHMAPQLLSISGSKHTTTDFSYRGGCNVPAFPSDPGPEAAESIT